MRPACVKLGEFKHCLFSSRIDGVLPVVVRPLRPRGMRLLPVASALQDQRLFGPGRLGHQDVWVEGYVTGALLDRLTHHVSILKMNGDSYRFAQSRARQARQNR